MAEVINRISKIDLAAIKAKLNGGAFFTVCCHPDIANSDYGPNSRFRQCVIDQGRPDQCDQSDPNYTKSVKAKENCQFWQPHQFKRPTRITIEEAKALVAIIEDTPDA